tara:strand:+ start:12719 stop:12874 length:156 start_codon:yes stop_codon:yes gene_type:complete
MNLVLAIVCFILGGLMVLHGESTFAVVIGYLQFGLAGFNLRNYIEEKRNGK